MRIFFLLSGSQPLLYLYRRRQGARHVMLLFANRHNSFFFCARQRELPPAIPLRYSAAREPTQASSSSFTSLAPSRKLSSGLMACHSSVRQPICKYNITTLISCRFFFFSFFLLSHCCRKQSTQCCLPLDCGLLGSAYIGLQQSAHVNLLLEVASTFKLHESASTRLVSSNLHISQSSPSEAMPQVVAPIHQAAHIV